MDRLKSVDVEDILDSDSKEDLVQKIINKNLSTLFYASPSTQFDYFERVIGVQIPQSKKESWIELKATRDLLVHNAGKINDIYLKKSGSAARGSLGELIEIDQKYFDQSVEQTKSLIGKIASQLQGKYGRKKK